MDGSVPFLSRLTCKRPCTGSPCSQLSETKFGCSQRCRQFSRFSAAVGISREGNRSQTSSRAVQHQHWGREADWIDDDRQAVDEKRTICAGEKIEL